MRFRASTAAVAMALAGTALAATACGSGTAQVVGNAPGTHAAAPHTTMQVAPPTSTTAVPTAPPTTAPTNPATTTTTAPAASPVSPATVNQLNAALGALGQSLNQADNDLAQAQGDQ
jgi:hypothetical protein